MLRLWAEEVMPMVKVVIAGLVGACLLFYIMSSPRQVASGFHGTGHAATQVAHSIGHFFDELTH